MQNYKITYGQKLAVILAGLLICTMTNLARAHQISTSSENFVYLNSDLGEKLLNGQELKMESFRDFKVSRELSDSNRAMLVIRAVTLNDVHLRIEFTAASGRPFSVGTYDFVRDQRREFARHGGISIVYDGRTLTNVKARFEVQEIELDPQGGVRRLSAQFVILKNNLGRDVFLKGAVRYQSRLPILLPILIGPTHDPENRVHNEMSIVDSSGNGSRRSNHLNGRFYMESHRPFVVNSPWTESLRIQFAAPLEEGTDGQFFIEPIPADSNLHLQVGIYDGRRFSLSDFGQCFGGINQTMEILEIVRDSNQKILKFAADLQINCGVHGIQQIRIRSHR